MIKITLTLILCISFQIIHAQTELDTTYFDNLKIWNSKKEYHYRALYIGINGDTITNEKIIVKPQDIRWDTKIGENQIILKYVYNYSHEDSLKLAPNPVNQTRWTKKRNHIKWNRTVKEGAIETNKLLWMHPFRMNQYSLTEVAPFPEVYKPLYEGKEWGSTMFVNIGWGTFKGIHKQKIKVVKKVEINSFVSPFLKCWIIDGFSTHKKLGESKITYYYNEEYGFVEMNYIFFNNQRISFILENVIENIN